MSLRDEFKDLGNSANIEDAKIVDDVDVEFAEMDFTEDLTKKKSTEYGGAQNQQSEPEPQKEKTEEEKKKETEEAQKKTADDYDDISMFAIELVDGGVSNLLKYISKETSARQFMLETVTKNRLKKHLNNILVKHQLQMSVEFMFFIALCAAYMVPVKNAIKLRAKNEAEAKAKKEEAERKAARDKAAKNETVYEQTIQSKYERLKDEVIVEAVVEAEIIHEQKTEEKPPKKGRPSKKEKEERKQQNKYVDIEPEEELFNEPIQRN